jgi:hypothetical protein
MSEIKDITNETKQANSAATGGAAKKDNRKIKHVNKKLNFKFKFHFQKLKTTPRPATRRKSQKLN